jgi:hypothetical protein
LDPVLEGQVARSLKVSGSKRVIVLLCNKIKIHLKVSMVEMVAAEAMYRPVTATEAVVEAVHPGHKQFFFGRI